MSNKTNRQIQGIEPLQNPRIHTRPLVPQQSLIIIIILLHIMCFILHNTNKIIINDIVQICYKYVLVEFEILKHIQNHNV